MLRDWARCFATCGDIVAAASTLAASGAGAHRQGSGRAQGQGEGYDDGHVDVPAARPRPTSNNPPARNPAVTGVLTEAAAAAVQVARGPAVQSRFYQSALRAADKAAREEVAQRAHALAPRPPALPQGAPSPPAHGRPPPADDLSLEACRQVSELLARCRSSPAPPALP